MNARAERMSRNEALFRTVNEKIETVNRTFGALAGDFAIVCECGSPTCMDQLRVPPELYERTRSEPTLYIVRPGHEIEDVEDVVDRGDGYLVVRKKPGLPAESAREADVRAD